jgi:hypothetical protein
VLSLAKRTSSVVREMRRLRRARRQAELTEFASEVEEARPFLELAREIQGEVARIAADPSAHSDLLVELLERIPREERMKLARTVFDQLHPEQQWAIIEQVYGDGEITAYLEAERSARLAEARLGAQRLDTARKARADDHLDTRDVTRARCSLWVSSASTTFGPPSPGATRRPPVPGGSSSGAWGRARSR